jgi:hypothetical protein
MFLVGNGNETLAANVDDNVESVNDMTSRMVTESGTMDDCEDGILSIVLEPDSVDVTTAGNSRQASRLSVQTQQLSDGTSSSCVQHVTHCPAAFKINGTAHDAQVPESSLHVMHEFWHGRQMYNGS